MRKYWVAASAVVLWVSCMWGCTGNASDSQRAMSRNPYSCTELACGIPEEGAYSHLIVGWVVNTGSTLDSEALFKRMRAIGRWRDLPADLSLYSQSLIPIVIDSSRGVMTVLMARWEFSRVPLHQGDLVRYSPHNGGVEPPPRDSVAHRYWDIDGCVLVLCRAGDERCASYYSPGIYRKRDGVAIAAADQKPLPGVAQVDPVTMFRKKNAH